MCYDFFSGALTFFPATFRPSRPAQSIRMTFLHISQWCDFFLQSDSSQSWSRLKLVMSLTYSGAMEGANPYCSNCTVQILTACMLRFFSLGVSNFKTTQRYDESLWRKKSHHQEMCKNAIQIDCAGLEGPKSIKKKVMDRRKKTLQYLCFIYEERLTLLFPVSSLELRQQLFGASTIESMPIPTTMWGKISDPPTRIFAQSTSK